MSMPKTHTKLPLKSRLIHGALCVAASLPRPVSWAMAGAIARTLRFVGARSARVTAENIALCYPHLSVGEQALLTHESLHHTAYLLFESAKVWTWPWPRLKPLLNVAPETEARLQAALSEGNGVVILAPHHGNWELLGRYLQQVDNLKVLYQPGQSPAFDQLILHYRQVDGTQVLPTNRKGVMGLFKWLKQGGLTGVLPDQVPERDSGGDFAPFFGVQAMTMTLIHNLIQRTGCKVLSGACLRKGSAFELVLDEPHADIYSKDAQTSLAGLNKSVEQLVAKAPAQYQWEYKRFRRVKPGEPRRYDYKKRK
ncbi:lysophospholipid acyltransferase family protein [Simiduia sp. 21SJ11W-1]|uniref:lysophospholipid acyltransferase family protein n=1 Tax=Simiduia sp. 21SJ11W-1 TaxID=2909669 RepID=UPI00209F7F29|nr:lysophospholipid acyltransferase family protein [Simiduia sp. 21SJ11W-1]UTA47927.1 lysophospholipid acyltransferase family protein [Simiduia sp. 21SJ11W-1]